MYTVARKLERPNGNIDIVGSTTNFGHLLRAITSNYTNVGSTCCLHGFLPHGLHMSILTANKSPRWGATTRYVARSTWGPLCP